MNGLLSDINVLDFGRAAVGPWAASLLGSMGANVIRVESPDGDGLLKQQPLQNGYGVAYTAYNANKKGLILDLKSPDSAPHLRRLVEKADLIMENLTPGALDRIGAGYEATKAINPSVVYASSPGWGYEGPIKDLGAGDPDFQAFSGFASLNGDEGGRMEMFRHAYPLDLHAGILFAATALLGLLARDKTGRSQWVNTSHLGNSLLIQISRISEYLATGQTPKPLGSASSSTAPHEAFLCEDQRYLAVGVENDTQWQGLCKALDREDLLENQSWSTNRGRVKGRQALAQQLSRTLSTKPSRWWAIQLEKNDVPFGYFYDFETLRNHRQVTENNFFFETNVSDQGRMFFGNAPWKFSSTETRIEAGPRHGQHTAELLEKGFDIFGNGVSRITSPTPSQSDNSPPLTSIRVVDASQGLAGPYLSLLLADAGAEIIKIEPPTGDYGRQFAPFYEDGESAPFSLLNRNKKSITLDTSSPEGIRILGQLIDDSDIFVEDWGPSKAESLGLGYETLRSRNPGLIHCAISAFGEHGPFKDRPASELVAQAYSECFLSLGQLNAAPLRAGADMGSMSTGAAGFLGTLAALCRRGRTGEGERVAISLFGTLVSLRQANWTSLGDPDIWAGGYAEPYGGQRIFGHTTKDMQLFTRPQRFTAMDTEALVAKIREVTGDRGYEGGPKLGPGALRLPLPEEYFKNLTAAEAKEILFSVGAQAVDFNNIRQVVEHPQTEAVGVIKNMDDPTRGSRRVLVKSWNGPWKDPALVPVPDLGQHNTELLSRLE